MIIIRNREMMIPKTEQYIGTPYDHESDARFFKIERLLPGQIDLADFAFALDLQFSDGTTDSVALEKDVLSDRIILKWVLTDTVLAKTGSVFAQIRAASVSGLKWSTAKTAFYIMDTISNPGAVTPSTSLTELEQLETRIEASEAIRIASETARATAETERADAEETRIENETARVAAETARASAEVLRISAETARAAAEAERASTFNEKALLSKSWAVGDTGVREGEDTNNSFYWAEQSENSAQRSETARELQPVIRSDYWYIWDTETEEYVNSGVKATGGAAEGAVLYNTSQSLSDSEKQTARLNMGAASSADLAAKYVKPADGIPKTDLAEAVQTSLGLADTALQTHQDISGKENVSNKVTVMTAASTDDQYPSAKAVYNEFDDVKASLTHKVDATEAQSFTDAQKLQARSNIGVNNVGTLGYTVASTWT